MKKLLLASLLFLTCASNLQCKQLITNQDLDNIQYEIQWKDDCVTHNLHTILKINGININEENVYEYSKCPRGGVYSEDAVDYINSTYNTKIQKVSRIDKESFISELDNKNVVFIVVKADLFYNNSTYEGETHFLSIVGYEDDNFIVLDTNKEELQKINCKNIFDCIYIGYTPTTYNCENKYLTSN